MNKFNADIQIEIFDTSHNVPNNGTNGSKENKGNKGIKGNKREQRDRTKDQKRDQRDICDQMGVKDLYVKQIVIID